MELRTGNASENVLDRSVFKRLGSVYRPDGCCSHTVTLPSRDAGFLAVTGLVNRLAANGFTAEGIQSVVLLPAGSPEDVLREMEDDIARAARRYGLNVTGGHTEVTGAVHRPVVTVYAVGLRKMAESTGPACGRRESHTAKAGDAVVMAGWVGLEGTMVLAREKRQELAKRFPLFLIDSAQQMREILCVQEAARTGAARGSCMVSASAGGIMAALRAFGHRTGKGFEIRLPDVPIRQETIEISEFYGINPYEMASNGCLVMTAEDGEALVQELTAAGIHATVTGFLMDGNDRILTNGGERSHLNLAPADALLSVLG